jgi:predicted GTPase
LLSYALGRELEYFDGSAVRGIVSQAAASSYTFASLVQGIVTSIPFQKRLAVGVQISNTAVQTASAQP